MKHVVMATWDDAPHLSKQQKEDLWASYPPHMRDARSKGVPQLGSGAIYPIPESDILVEPFEIPKYWPKMFAMDVGWKMTAALWGARDLQAGVTYLYSEYARGTAEPSIHAHAVRARGEWIPGAIDPAARGRSQLDGRDLFGIYLDLGLNLYKADNTVESGLYDVLQALSSGKLKIFSTMNSFLGEFRIYRRDEKGKVVKENDHLMDCMRYLWTSLDIAHAEPFDEYEDEYAAGGASSVTGY